MTHLSSWHFRLPAIAANCFVALVQGICYLSDKSYFRLGMVPQWYMTLRGWLTTLAALGCISTFLHYIGECTALIPQNLLSRVEGWVLLMNIILPFELHSVCSVGLMFLLAPST